MCFLLIQQVATSFTSVAPCIICFFLLHCKSIMERYSVHVVLMKTNFLWCGHSYKTSSAVLLHGSTICFLKCFGFLVLLGVTGVKHPYYSTLIPILLLTDYPYCYLLMPVFILLTPVLFLTDTHIVFLPTLGVLVMTLPPPPPPPTHP